MMSSSASPRAPEDTENTLAQIEQLLEFVDDRLVRVDVADQHQHGALRADAVGVQGAQRAGDRQPGLGRPDDRVHVSPLGRDERVGELLAVILDQLAPGGRMVIPVGSFFQELKVLSKDKNGKISEKDILPVRFVPMTGEIEKTPPAPE